MRTKQRMKSKIRPHQFYIKKWNSFYSIQIRQQILSNSQGFADCLNCRTSKFLKIVESLKDCSKWLCSFMDIQTPVIGFHDRNNLFFTIDKSNDLFSNSFLRDPSFFLFEIPISLYSLVISEIKIIICGRRITANLLPQKSTSGQERIPRRLCLLRPEIHCIWWCIGCTV